jgi:hypothetical protein
MSWGYPRVITGIRRFRANLAFVQTFLPYPDFAASARVLDVRRLGKQRVEALQIFRALTVPTYGWKHHPAVKMWAGYEEALIRYGLAMCLEWTDAGRADTVAATLMAEWGGVPREQPELAAAGELPPSHQSSLVRKDPAHYRPAFADVPDDLEYVWPGSDRTPIKS